MKGKLLIEREDLHRMYVNSFNELNVKKEVLAYIVGQGEFSVSTVNAIRAKLKGGKGKMPTKADVAWLKALVAIKRLGYDVEKIEFDDNKELVLRQ